MYRSLFVIFLSPRQWTDVGNGQMHESLLLSSWDSVTVTLSWTCSQCCCSQNNTNPQSARIDSMSPTASAFSLSISTKKKLLIQHRGREREMDLISNYGPQWLSLRQHRLKLLSRAPLRVSGGICPMSALSPPLNHWSASAALQFIRAVTRWQPLTQFLRAYEKTQRATDIFRMITTII